MKTSALYFIAAPQVAAVKIGITDCVSRRLKQISSCSPTPLELLLAVRGTYADERAIHLELAATRLHAEWFQDTPQLHSIIATYRLRPDAPSEPGFELGSVLCDSPAFRIVSAFGGGNYDAGLHRLSALLGMQVKWLHRWARPLEQNGGDGKIPLRHRGRILAEAAAEGVSLFDYDVARGFKTITHKEIQLMRSAGIARDLRRAFSGAAA